jgi:hypothetical protein
MSRATHKSLSTGEWIVAFHQAAATVWKNTRPKPRFESSFFANSGYVCRGALVFLPSDEFAVNCIYELFSRASKSPVSLSAQ